VAQTAPRPGGNRILVPYGRAGKFARCETH
jgi:hypothetical protein